MTVPEEHETRARVAHVLDQLGEKGGLLDPDTHSSTVRYGSTVLSGHRARVHASVRDEYLDRSSASVVRERRAALLTSGPPGAGKTTAMGRQFEGYREIDPDEIKDLLLKRSLVAGDYEAQLVQQLPDGFSVMPRELSGLFHEESIRVAAQVRAIALRRGENVILQGTLAWLGFGRRLVEELSERDYKKLTVFSVEVDADTAQERAMQRWWAGRQDAIKGIDPLGGRYMNVLARRSLYWSADGTSICRANARSVAEIARTETAMSVKLREA